MPTALVTGASHGLGEAYARELAERGYSIVLVARDADLLAEMAERIGRATGAIVEPLAADLADPAGVTAVERRIADPAPPVELLVHTAAGATGIAAGATDQLVRAAATAMTARGRGGILAVAEDPGPDEDAWSRPAAIAGPVAASLHGTGVTITVVVAGRAASQPAEVVHRSLRDLARGRTVSLPGRLQRLVTRPAGRLAARVTGHGRPRPEPGPMAGHTRPSPVPTPFRDAPSPVRAVPAGGGGPSVLPELPARPAHVPAAGSPVARESGTGPLPAVPARPGIEGTGRTRVVVHRLPGPPRPVQGPGYHGATVRLATG
ncbi:Short-chain dehydrogenase [Pseudonocardia ammonioxydans]|uniref:Short-chain dehydrogenase n=1 Tax=Pseudonocardia ammonioxydans TaxID=260086 RepID=A0A1I5BGX8_PSUAM|nr:SDR family NAD(P)-dependent oxidoreductase [Pseudonocardia ammonioxydans]SFN73741.1 Short-chain dehydrogenase [Pseudonocardia ammonioxydans]